MRILILNWRDLKHPRAGGAERYVDEIARVWHAEGHDVTLFCSATGSRPGTERIEHMTIVRDGGRLSVYPKAKRFMRSQEWDLIVESVNTRPWFAHRVIPGMPCVAIFHQLARDVWFYEAPFLVAAVGRFVLEPRWLRKYRGACVVAVSESTRQDLEASGIAGVRVVGQGRARVPDEARSLPKETVPTLMFLGRLQRSKRPDHALAAFRIVQQAIPDAQLWIVGDGPMRPKLERAAGNGAHVLGRVDEATKWNLLARARLLLVPSVREGWGLVVSEAAGVCTPAVAYRVHGLVDSVADEKTGWLCDPNAEAMAHTAKQALPRVFLAGRQAQASLERLSWDATAAAISDAAILPHASGRAGSR